jgi:SAM-dependent methyltransferase
MEGKALHFDVNSEIYDGVRPGYPQEIYNLISKFKKFDSNSMILEIGAGNGIASQEIYNNWQSKMVLIEPGENLCKLLHNRFKNNKDIKVENIFFEVYENENLFDAIISATAFHWLDLSIKYKKSYDLLKNDGLLILYWNNYGIKGNEIGEEIQKVYSKYGSGTNNGKSAYERQMEKIECRKNEIEESNVFNIIEHKIIKNVLEYTSEKYINLLKTFPDHLNMEKGFFTKIKDIIKSNGNKIDIRITINLEIAKKKLEKSGHSI